MSVCDKVHNDPSVKAFSDQKVTALHANGAFHAGLYEVLTRILMYSKFITLIITFYLLCSKILSQRAQKHYNLWQCLEFSSSGDPQSDDETSNSPALIRRSEHPSVSLPEYRWLNWTKAKSYLGQNGRRRNKANLCLLFSKCE